MKKYILLSLLITQSIVTVFSQDLKFKIKGQPDGTINLVKYVGSKLYYADTADIKNEIVTFDGSKQQPGVMAVLLPGQKYFEFIYNNEAVEIETEHNNFVTPMVVKKSEENKLFIPYIQMIQSSRERADALNKQADALPNDAVNKKKELKDQVNQISKDVITYQNKLIDENANTLAAKIIKMSMDIDLPEAPKNEDGSLKDSLFVYKYFRDHFWDNVDLQDDRLVNVPVLEKKVRQYISDRVLHQSPDSLIKYIAPVMNQLQEGSTMYRFFTTTISSHFEKSKIMGMDKVFHFMFLNYYCSKDKNGNYKGFWMKDSKLDEICEDIGTKSITDIGNKAPNIILTDTTEQNWLGFYDNGKEYTVLYFWDPDCGHCKKETPKLQKLYAQKLKDRNVGVFAIGKATGEDFEKWKKYIRENDLTFTNVALTNSIWEFANESQENVRTLIPSKTTVESLNYQQTYDIFSTPRVFVVDKNKRIVAKSLSIAQLEEYLDAVQGMPTAEKIFDVEQEKKEAEELEQKRKDAQKE